MTIPSLNALCLDTASPTTSVVLAKCGTQATMAAKWSSKELHSSRRLLAVIDQLLAEAGWQLADIDALIALAGPGSFTGARVGLATVYGLHQSLGVPALALPSTRALARLARADAPCILAAIDALRDEWYVEEFAAADPTHPQAPARLMKSQEVVRLKETVVVGFGVERLEALSPHPTCHLQPAAALANVAPTLLAAGELGDPRDWSPEALLHPIYTRPPAMVERRAAKQ